MCDPSRHPHVAMDIETTGKCVINDKMTVVCVWSPDETWFCFGDEDFSKIVEILNQAQTIYTFNGIHFDIPILAKHCGVDPSTWMLKTVDPLFLMFSTMGFGACRKLDLVLSDNGFENKSGSGLDAIEYWKNNERDKLMKYCMQDAKLTYDVCSLPLIKWGSCYVIDLYSNERVIRFTCSD